MPRRIPDYPDAFAGWNFASSMGSLISLSATICFIFVIFFAYTAGKSQENLAVAENNKETEENKVENNPWAFIAFFVGDKEKSFFPPFSTSLEFAVDSPTPTHVYNILPILTDNKLIS